MVKFCIEMGHFRGSVYHFHNRAILLLALGITACLPMFAFAGDRPQIFCKKTSNAITIDGKLDESDWAHAGAEYPAHKGGALPLEPAEVRMLWSDDGLYLAAHCLDTDIRGKETERDSKLWQDGDVAEFFMIPPEGDLTRIEIQVNARGTLADIGWLEGESFGPKTLGWDWQGIQLQVAHDGTINDGVRDASWTLEMFLPWSGLEGVGIDRPTEGDSWRFMAMIVNRSQLTEKRASRTLAFWPVLSKALATVVDEYAQMTFVTPAENTDLFDGFRAIVHGQSGHLGAIRGDYRGKAPRWIVDDQGRLAWSTEQLPDKLPPRVRFCWSVNASESLAKGEFHEFGLNGTPIISFGTIPPEDHTWKHGDVIVRYHHRSGSSRWRAGVMELEVPADQLVPGESAIISLINHGEISADQLRLSGRIDTVLYETHTRGVQAGLTSD